MAVVRLVLGIGLSMLAILLLLVLGLLCTRAWLWYHGENRSQQLQIGIGPFRMQILPRRRVLPAKGEGRRSAEADKPRDAAPPTRDLGAIAYQVLDLLDSVRDSLIIRKLTVDVMLGTPDAAQTGILLGSCGAVAGMFYPYLEQNFNIKTCRIAVDADFEASKIRWEAEAECSIRLLGLVRIFLRDHGKLKELMDLFRFDEEEKV